MKGPIHESEDDRKSRQLLSQFLTTTEALMDRFLQELILEVRDAASRGGRQLSAIWHSARENLKRVVESVDIGLSRTRRDALTRVGMFGDALTAKWELLSMDISEGVVRRVLKRLNSMLSSLAKVFPALHAVKEFKDHVEATIEGLKDVPELLALKDLLSE